MLKPFATTLVLQVALLSICGVQAEDKLGKANAPSQSISGKVTDQDGKPVAEARVRFQHKYAEIDTSTSTDAEGRFALNLRMVNGVEYSLRIWAKSSDEASMGCFRVARSEDEPTLNDIEIRLEPLKTARVKVVDVEGKAVESANVALQLGFPYTVGPQTTDATGTASLKIPRSEKIGGVVAWKNGYGLDYQAYTRRQSGTEEVPQKPLEFPIDTEETLQLDGAAPLEIRATGPHDKVVKDAEVSLWLLTKEGRSDQLNFGYYTDVFPQNVDDQGTVRFEWFPKWQKEPVQLNVMAKGYVQKQTNYDPSAKAGPVLLSLQSLEPIRGQVTQLDGQPAANITVQAIGDGYESSSAMAIDQTDDAGRYELLVAPDNIYMVFIVDKQWSAPIQTGFAVRPGQPVAPRDFKLRKATRLHGQVLNKANGRPVPGTNVTLQQSGMDLRTLAKTRCLILTTHAAGSVRCGNATSRRTRAVPLSFLLGKANTNCTLVTDGRPQTLWKRNVSPLLKRLRNKST